MPVKDIKLVKSVNNEPGSSWAFITFVQLIASRVRLISETGKLSSRGYHTVNPALKRTDKFLAVSSIKPRHFYIGRSMK
jgi:hypothetical protein